MDELSLKRLWAAIDKTEKLFKKRGSPEEWSINIQEGMEDLQTPLEFGNFIHWLHDSENYKVKHDIEFADYDKIDLPELHPSLEERYYTNGTDCIIHVRNNHFNDESANELDEKENDSK